jgi:hypothetical protein
MVNVHKNAPFLEVAISRTGQWFSDEEICFAFVFVRRRSAEA